MERVESSFLLLAAVSIRLKFTDFTYQWSKSSAPPPGAAGCCSRLARRGVVRHALCAPPLASLQLQTKGRRGQFQIFLRAYVVEAV